MNLRETFLEKFLNTTASSQNYIPTLDSYLYNTQKSPKGYPKIPFIIQTVDINGSSKPYTLYGQTMVGLVLLINPASVSVNLAKMINRNQTMTSWLEEHWGEELDTITFQGSSASFIWGGPSVSNSGFDMPLDQTPNQIRNMFNSYMDIPDLSPSEPVGIGDYNGLTAKRRRETLSYQEFRRIIQFMNSNAATFDIRGMVAERLYIQLAYDYACYRGYFESIDITENAETPYKFIYTITFKSEKTDYKFLR